MKRRSENDRRRRSRGSALVEGTLILLSVALLLIAAFDFGQFLFVHQALVERARRAARWGVVNNPNDYTSIRNMVLYHSPVSSQPDGTTLTPYMGLTNSNVDVAVLGAGTDAERLRVRITGFRYTVVSPYIAGGYTGPNIDVIMPVGSTN
jgi:Flp pilus assembly protein TadG